MRSSFDPERAHAVILAGGRGTRLKPYTTFVPKPLMPIGDIPIIEVVLQQLKSIGIRHVTLAVGHLAQLIQAFVGNGQKFGMKIDYSFETVPLGTAGPLGLIREKLSNTDWFLTLNGDVLTTLNYQAAIDFHLKSQAAATICLNSREVKVEFGVIRSDGRGDLLAYEEKPTLTYDVSMGINIFSPAALRYVKPDAVLNIPDLMINMKNAGEMVKCYRDPNCYWLDIGRVEDYHTACDVFEKRRMEFLPDEQ